MTGMDMNPDSSEAEAPENDTNGPMGDDKPTCSESNDTNSADKKPVDEESTDKKATRRRVSISLRGLLHGVLIAALVATIGLLAWLYWETQDKLDVSARRTENYEHAEKIALNYAANAAAMDFQNLGVWKDKLVAGTTPELKDKLTKAATSMEQILVPLQWSSTASPLVAKVRSNTGTTYAVDAFVSVQTKTLQAPDPLQSTAAYTITIDSSKDWQISDVGGIGAMVEGK
ncbi:MAG: hypothetical protein WB785_21010 [Mycobacterium sp.]|uniref:hypothetical protein n=1 Tax=Mycobacterium sp. TaxID=1785 RepID=UPI003C3E471E